jgi:putative transposase
LSSPGKNVRSKSCLNKSILDQGWYELRRELSYKLRWRGGELILVPPNYTSQQCSVCGSVNKANRISQSRFKCVSCGYESNADLNASRNILAAGHAVLACGVEKAKASTLKQEPILRHERKLLMSD